MDIAAIGIELATLWLIRHDIAWRTVGQAGLPRFMAVCLLTGYFWLAFGEILWLVFAQQFVGGLRYDAILHSIFLGFVVSMIFAHAPAILPSIIGVALPYRPMFYSHVALLHASLLLRIGGDLGLSIAAQRWGALLNIAAVLLFIFNNLRAAKSNPKHSLR